MKLLPVANTATNCNGRSPRLRCISPVMNTREQPFKGTLYDRAGPHSHSIHQVGSTVPFVTRAEIQAMADAVATGILPADFEAKLKSLARGDIIHQNIEKNCRRFFSLLQADRDGLFTELSPDQRQYLLAVLAYVRKDDDAVADYLPGGYVDDQSHVRAVTADFAPILEHFNLWRLRYQVPKLWTLAVSEQSVFLTWTHAIPPASRKRR